MIAIDFNKEIHEELYIEEFYGKTIFMKNFIKKLCINKKNNY